MPSISQGRFIARAMLSSKEYCSLSPLAKVLYPILRVNCDDQGRCEGEPAFIKAALCPRVNELTPNNIPGLLQEMVAVGLVLSYRAEVGTFLQVADWWEHQKIQWAYPSDFPPPDGWQDHFRFRQGGKVVTINWRDSQDTDLDGFTLPFNYRRSLARVLGKGPIGKENAQSPADGNTPSEEEVQSSTEHNALGKEPIGKVSYHSHSHSSQSQTKGVRARGARAQHPEAEKKDTEAGLAGSPVPEGQKSEVQRILDTVAGLAGYPVPHFKKEAHEVKTALRQGYTPEQIVSCWNVGRQSPRWRGIWFQFAYVVEDLGEFVKGGQKPIRRWQGQGRREHGEPGEHPAPDSGEEFFRGLPDTGIDRK